MKVWKLTPTHPGDKVGYVRIRASSETRAREIAATAFAHSKAVTSHSSQWADLDWHNAMEVMASLEDEDISNQEGIMDVE